MDVCGDAQLTATQCGRTTSSTSPSNTPRNNIFMNTWDAGTFSTTILSSSDLGPPVLLYPSPTLTTRMNYVEDLSLSYPHLHSNSNSNSQDNDGASHSDDTSSALSVPQPTIEIPLDELLRGMDGFDGMEGMKGLDGGDDMDGLLNHLHLVRRGQVTPRQIPRIPRVVQPIYSNYDNGVVVDSPVVRYHLLSSTVQKSQRERFHGEDKSQDVEMFDHSSSAYHPLIFDDNPNNEHIFSFDRDLNSAEPIQIPIPTVSRDSLRVLFGDSPSGRSDGRSLTPLEEALSFSGQQGRLSRLSSPTSRSSHHTHLSNHKDDADLVESVELMMSSTTTMTLSSAQHSTEFVYSGAGSSKSLSQRRSTTPRPSSPTGGGGGVAGGLSVSSKPRASSKPHNRPKPRANARAMPRPSARQTSRAGVRNIHTSNNTTPRSSAAASSRPALTVQTSSSEVSTRSSLPMSAGAESTVTIWSVTRPSSLNPKQETLPQLLALSLPSRFVSEAEMDQDSEIVLDMDDYLDVLPHAAPQVVPRPPQHILEHETEVLDIDSDVDAGWPTVPLTPLRHHLLSDDDMKGMDICAANPSFSPVPFAHRIASHSEPGSDRFKGPPSLDFGSDNSDKEEQDHILISFPPIHEARRHSHCPRTPHGLDSAFKFFNYHKAHTPIFMDSDNVASNTFLDADMLTNAMDVKFDFDLEADVDADALPLHPQLHSSSGFNMVTSQCNQYRAEDDGTIGKSDWELDFTEDITRLNKM
ncbi:hypothetical protein C8J55DRAFT_560941 [Lentinula edodes]|uniref:Uncharacterized protein n=1 Tax=Lentinula lateritia TaxID=40482 RepID=A0A9W9AFK4_9AGAR|nr:hypothetical protein C8J55DRAFT_560941 [Lentinula edodes]